MTTYTENQLALQAVLAAEKQKVLDWIAEKPGRWGGYPCQDLEHWAEYGVTSPEEYEIYGLKADIWDTYKEVFGVRPRHLNLDSMNIMELLLYKGSLELEMKREAARSKAREEKKIQEFDYNIVVWDDDN